MLSSLPHSHSSWCRVLALVSSAMLEGSLATVEGYPPQQKYYRAECSIRYRCLTEWSIKCTCSSRHSKYHQHAHACLPLRLQRSLRWSRHVQGGSWIACANILLSRLTGTWHASCHTDCVQDACRGGFCQSVTQVSGWHMVYNLRHWTQQYKQPWLLAGM